MAQEPNNDAPLSGNVLFYKSPEPLNPEVHGGMGLKAVDHPHAFVAETNVVPLTVSEFPAASLSYPIVFIGDNNMPVAAMGLSSSQNVFVSPEGAFKSDSYLPAFARRYPFVFANDEQQQRMILCVDVGAPMVVKSNPDVPFFDKDGKGTPYLDNAMQFCTDFENERRRTESFVQMLRDLDLLAARETVYRPQNPDGTAGEPQKIAEYFAVDEQKLNALSAEKFAELRDNGALTHIYAHMNSLLAWDRLIALTIERNNAQAAAN
jgi:hypothetical protein